MLLYFTTYLEYLKILCIKIAENFTLFKVCTEHFFSAMHMDELVIKEKIKKRFFFGGGRSKMVENEQGLKDNKFGFS